MRHTAWVGALVLAWIVPSQAQAQFHRPTDLNAVNRTLAGQVIDFTHNHGTDRRIWSPALCQKRDLYIYLPPGFDPNQRYPLVLWLHGFLQDEKSVLTSVVGELDREIRCGRLPPLILAAPDGSLEGEPSFSSAGSFFVNSKAGNFEDFTIQDVFGFVTAHFPIRPEREAHVLAGVSMGGFAAYNLGIKYQNNFKLVLGIFPPLNLRWVNCRGRYMAQFDPCCWGWRTEVDHGHEVVGRFYHGLITIRLKKVIDPLFGRGPEAIAAVIRENPIEMIDTYGLQPGALDMYIAYSGRDEYNIDAQVESFLYRTRERGLCVRVGYDAKGRHNLATAQRLFPGVVKWLGPRLAPYSPGCSGQPTEEPSQPGR